MSTLVLRLKERPPVPLEVESISPDVLGGLTHAEVAATPVQLGKRRLRLDDFFDVEGDGSERIVLHGDLRQLKWIGRGMTRGSMEVHGSVGMHLGAYMRGGSIHVRGDAGDWVGAEMTAGLIRIDGSAGGQVGAAYRGSLAGMRNGTILIGGGAGLEIGMRMKKGTIVVGGPVKDFAGLQMKGGTIVLLSGAEIRTGAWMIRGTIISLRPLQLLPTFSPACSGHPLFLQLLARYLQPWGIQLPQAGEGSYDLFSGDTSVPGKGEILVWRAAQV